MFENILNFFRKLGKNENKETSGSKNKAKERLHLVLMQDRANVSADFLEMMKQEIIDVIKKYIEVEESEIDVRLTNEVKEDGTTGAPSLYANIPIANIRNDMKKEIETEQQTKQKVNKDENNEKNKDEDTNKSDDKELKEEIKEETPVAETQVTEQKNEDDSEKTEKEDEKKEE